jgi:hypothetical protein
MVEIVSYFGTQQRNSTSQDWVSLVVDDQLSTYPPQMGVDQPGTEPEVHPLPEPVIRVSKMNKEDEADATQ